LSLKASEIETSKSMCVVLILGRFHLMMSFLGSVGILTKGSGLSESLHSKYGVNTVGHMSGKAVSRALRGHYLVESALTTKLLRTFIQDETTDLQSNNDNQDEKSDDTEFSYEHQNLEGYVFKDVDVD
jgi:hypothetical protein